MKVVLLSKKCPTKIALVSWVLTFAAWMVKMIEEQVSIFAMPTNCAGVSILNSDIKFLAVTWVMPGLPQQPGERDPNYRFR
jgi:hypothetical protein